MSDEVSALVSVPHGGFPWSLATMNESSHSQGTPAYLGSLIPPLFPPLSLSEMTRALRAKVRSSGRGDCRCVLVSCLSMDAQQFRFPSLAPRVERGLPWSLPHPFCLSPGFSFPVDPYRTGEFLLAVSVTPRQSLAAVLHTLRHFSFDVSKGCSFFKQFLWASDVAVHAH